MAFAALPILVPLFNLPDFRYDPFVVIIIVVSIVCGTQTVRIPRLKNWGKSGSGIYEA